MTAIMLYKSMACDCRAHEARYLPSKTRRQLSGLPIQQILALNTIIVKPLQINNIEALEFY